MILKTFGRNPIGKRLARIKASAIYSKDGFQNQSPTKMMADDVSYFQVGKDFLFKAKDNEPKSKIPAQKIDLKKLASTHNSIVWFGHSGYLLNLKGKIILVDPVLCGSASPVKTMIKAFAGADTYTADDFPEIDILIITHDHYDHLDHRFFLKIKNKVKSVLCSLGVGEHLERWGFPADKITELEWGQAANLNDIQFHCAPARHFSGRGLVRGKTLWSSFILKTNELSLYLGGDSGYDKHFKQIGKDFGPFDLAILECGQYNTSWPTIHMMPEETVQAAQDLNAKHLMPVHWGKFALALHGWKEPILRVTKAAIEKNIPLLTPQIGEEILIGILPAAQWWLELE